jgi:hypothetical protein
MSDIEEETWNKYVNIMEFEINMRAIWLPGSPAIVIQPQETIHGPEKYLSKFKFLQKIPPRMHQVSSIITCQDGSMQDVGENVHEHFSVEPIEEIVSEAEAEPIQITRQQLLDQGVDIDDVNWLKFTTDKLEEIATNVGIDISHVEGNKKARKWEIVRILKAAIIHDEEV